MDPNFCSIEDLATSDIDTRQETLPPNNQEEECVIMNSTTAEKCECNSTYFSNTCLEAAMTRYTPDIYLLCGSCFWRDSNSAFHECHLPQSDLQIRVNELFKDIYLINDFCQIYCEDHQISLFSVPLNNFQSAVQTWVGQNTSVLVDILIEKDKMAHTHFNWIN